MMEEGKPFTIARQEFEKELLGVIGRSGLPAIVLIDILEDKKRQLIPIANEEYENDLRNWEAYKAKKAKEEEAKKKQKETNKT